MLFRHFILFSVLLPLLLLGPFAFGVDDPVIVKEYKTVYEFELDKKTQSPVLKEHSTIQFEALRSNATATVVSFYDENSRILQAVAYNKRHRRFFPGEVCGNHENGDIFYSDAQLCRYQFSIDAKGDQNTLHITKQYDDLRYFTQVYFPFYYQVEDRVIEFQIPEWLDMALEEFNFPSAALEKHNAIDKKEWVDQKKGLKIIQYRQKGLKAFEDGFHLPGKSHTYPHIIPVVKSYEYKGSRQKILSNPDDLYEWYAGLVKEIGNNNSNVVEKTRELTTGQTSDLDKIKAIYYWVQDNIRYIAFEQGIAGFRPEACQSVFSNRYGDCKGMANLTKEMLLLAGYDARLAWIGTNSLAYTYNTPSLAVDNHMICVVFHQGDTLILDATEKFISLQDHGERIQGKEMMIEDGDNYLIHRVPQLFAKRNKKQAIYTLKMEGEKLLGKGQMILNGEQKTALLNYCNNVRNEGSEKLLKRYITGQDNNFHISELAYSSLDQREKPFTIDFSFELQNKVSAYGKEMYWQPDPSPEFHVLKVEEDRINAIDFNEKIDRQTEVSLVLPVGYKLSFLPEAFNSSADEFNISVDYEKKGNQVIYRRRVQIPSGKISTSSFEAWNQALKSLDEKYREQVIFTKK